MIMGMREKVIICTSLVVMSFAGGIFFSKIYQTPARAMKIYGEALADYDKEDYSNSYYLFSKVSPMSDLKPIALYRQAECAKAIGDNLTAHRKYKNVFKNYKNNLLAVRSKYLAAQLLVKDNPNLAKKYFEQIIKNSPDTDYAIAAEYYLGLMILREYTQGENQDSKVIFPISKQQDVEDHFRHYLKKAPAGRFSVNIVDNWLSLNKTISPDDYLLMANTLYLFGEYPRVKDLLEHANDAEKWVLEAKNNIVMGRKTEALAVLDNGLTSLRNYVSEDDVVDAINLYFSVSNKSKLNTANELGAKVSGKGQEYIDILKCKYSPSEEQLQCYKDYYLEHQHGKYAEKALAEIFLGTLNLNDLAAAKKIGNDYLNKFKKESSAPQVMFWLGKIAEKSKNYSEYMNIYKGVIANYPDTYYAYRAYLGMLHKQGAMLTDYINPKSVEYPYPLKNAMLKKLVELQDYDVIDELFGSDEFIKSWILYQKGDYSHSMLVARNAMDSLEKKPDKYDLRWRLVYPVHYYDEIKTAADKVGNNAPLMLSLTREESYFNPSASSSVGARGLMQLMPATAAEVAARKGISSYDLFDATSNIKLGNYYYAYLKSQLSGLDISAIASYNGGIGSVMHWKTSLYYNDTDEFVEQIPYDETQNYVKKVFRSYWNYIRIYNGNS